MLRGFERFYVVVALLFLAGGAIPSDTAQNDLSVRGQFNEATAIGDVAVFAVLAAILAVRARFILRCIPFAGWPLSLAGLALLSTLWSTNPVFSFKHGLLLIAVTFFGIYLGSSFELNEQISLIAWMLVLGVLGSIVMIVFFPKYGVSHDIHWGDWKGLFGHKNILGRMMAIAILTFGTFRVRGIPRSVTIPAIFGAAFLLVYSSSVSALVTAVGLFGMYPFLALIRSKTRAGAAAGVLVLAVLFGLFWLVLDNPEIILRALGRDATLTGRVYIWQAVLAAIAQRPWLGFGYLAFWSRLAGDSLAVAVVSGFNAPHAHNGYLDVCLDVGLVGLALFLSGLAIAICRALRQFRSDNSRAAKWIIFYLFFFLIDNLAASDILRPFSFLWIPYVSIFVWLGRIRRYERSRMVSLSEFDDERPDTGTLVPGGSAIASPISPAFGNGDMA